MTKNEQVRRRTANSDLDASSHVMQFGNMNQRKNVLFSYVGTNPANANYSYTDINAESSPPTFSTLVDQRDADLLHLRHKVYKPPSSSFLFYFLFSKFFNHLCINTDIYIYIYMAMCFLLSPSVP